MNIMLRWARRIVIFLLIGAIVNILLAWGCSLLHGEAAEYWEPYHNPRGENPLVVFVTNRFGQEIISGCERSGTLLARYPDDVKAYRGIIWWPRESVGWSRDRRSYAVASGWPMLTLKAWRTTIITDSGGDTPQYDELFHGCIHIERDVFGRQPDAGSDLVGLVAVLLPLHPIWWGMIGNTIIYAAALAIPLAIFASGRRAWRLRQHRCPTCGYSRGTSPVCTECGQPLPGIIAK